MIKISFSFGKIYVQLHTDETRELHLTCKLYTILGNNGKSFITPCAQEDLNEFPFIGPGMFK